MMIDAILIHHSGKIKFYKIDKKDQGYKLYNKLIGADMGEIVNVEIRKYSNDKGEEIAGDSMVMWIDENGRLTDKAYNNVASMIAGGVILGTVLMMKESDMKEDEEEAQKENKDKLAEPKKE